MLVEIHFTADPIVTPPEVLPSREIGAAVEFRGIVREKKESTIKASIEQPPARTRRPLRRVI